MTTILTHMYRVRAILALLFLSSASLWAQSDDATLINITTLAQLDAIHYDLDGNGVVSFTTAASLTGSPMFSDRAAVVTLMGADSIYAQAFTSGDFYTTAAATTAATGAVAASTAYYYKLSSAATSSYIGYELRNNLDFEDADGNGTADDKSIWAEGASGAGVSGAVAGGWAPLGYYNTSTDNTPYTATFDGRGYTISNLYVNRSSTDNVGLFGVLGTGGNLRNLGIEGGSLRGSFFVGGLVGYSVGTISACYATGDANSGKSDVGGLVGWNDTGGKISACYATGDASGTGFVGGLVGQNNGPIRACYATGDASGNNRIGGLVGGNRSTIRACYATGGASGNDNVGGLVGWNHSSGTVTNSYFDRNVSNRPASDDYDKTTAQLKMPTSYAGIYSNWNIDVDNGQPIGVDNGTAAGDSGTDNPWDFGTSSQYPVLKVDFNVDGAPSVAEFGTQPRIVSLRVSSFTPERGVVGATVTIRGKAFGATATDNTVVFLGAAADADNRSATVSAATATSLTVTVPTAAQTGPISVMVGTAADTSSQDYTVLIGEDKDENDNGLIEVSSLEQLDAIRYDLDGDGIPSGTDPQQTAYRTAFGLTGTNNNTCTGGCSGYELMSNLDFEDADGNGTADDKSIWAEGAGGAGVPDAVAEGWAPIGGTFTATFDGRGHTISNLYINRPSTNNVSLFGVLGTEGNVRNLGIEGGSLTGAKYVGGLVGYNLGTISACYATGDASGSGSVGGLVGWSNATISACYATGNATGNGQQTGGLVGDNRGTIRACYATGNASGGENVGGLVGFSDSTIRACYATGNANGGSNVGGLVGFNFGTVTKSYFDRTVSNRPASDRDDKTTAQLQTPTAYTGIYSNWNIDVDNGQPIGVDNGTAAGDPGTDNPWDFGSDSEYPALKVDFNVDGTPSAAEFGTQRHTASLGVFSFTPERGVVGATVTIRGRLFSTTATDNTVTFIGAEGDADNAAAMVSTSPAATTTELTVTVPPNAQTGPISVMVGAAADTSSQDFTVWIPEDKDANDNGLIEVSSLEQLDAIRYDLDGNGVPSGTELEQAAYRTAFGLSGGATIVSCTGGCEGYELINNLDFEDADGDGTADDKSIWAEGASAAGVSGAVADGWVLISGRFTATFEGNNYTISNLYINRSSADNVGLFRALGAGGNVRNLGIEGGSVRGRNRVGGLVGENIGGTISDCHAIVDVTAFNNDVGGLVGENEGGTITNSYATGYVRGSGVTTGGLVGWNNGGTISACYATGNVRGSGNNVGGLVGANEGGAIRACYATGNANGGGSVGGLAGANKKKGATNATISACYATGTVRGTANNVGGLVGSNSGTISACYATRAASGASNVGGLVGSNSGTITNSYFDSTVSSALATTPIGGGTTTGSDVTNVSGKTTADLQMPMAYGTAMDIYSLWNIDVDDGLAVGVDDGTAAGDATADDPWDFGTSGQYPALKVDFDGNGTATADEFGSQRTTRFLATRYMADIELGISAGSEIGTVAAVPADFNNTLSYTILSQTLNGAAVSYFLIANTASGGTNVGTISVADPAPTEAGIYTLSVEVSDGVGGTATTEVIINLYLLLLMSEGEFTVCSGKFMDTGGESGNYGNNEDITMTISPESAADRVRVEFTSFQVEAEANCIYDKLEVYNGATTSAPLIDFYCGTNSLGVVLVVLSSSAGGKLTFRFKSDGDTNFFGWEATISCVPAVPAAPPAAPTALTATVADAEVTLSWDAPVNDGGAVITGYMIEYDTDMNFSSPPTTVSTMDHATSYTVSGLANGTLYYFRVAAVNSAGTGASGTAVSATPATNLIDVTTLEQLDAIRYDLDGNGTPSGTTAEQAAYRTAFGLTGMNNNTCTGDCGGYELRNNLDFAGTKWENPTGGTFTGTHETGGWAPLGYYNSPTDFADYTATFDGRDHTISNLYINRPSTSSVGLFGDLVGNVRNLGIEGGSLSGAGFVGGLVGYSEGTISDCYATGDVTGSSGEVGGLVGESFGTISACYATGNATGNSQYVGGLVGYNGGTISACYSTGDASGSVDVGGISGGHDGTISACSATGNASGSNNVGGLVGGYISGTISACYATGNATGTGSRVGGLVGENFDGAISACYATGDATGTGSRVGGLVGDNFGTISACYATGNATGGDNVGGLVGINLSSIRACYATGDATGTGSRVGGLAGYNSSTIRACYATGNANGTSDVGGLVGFNFGTVRNSYFDSTVSNRTDSDDYSKTTTQLQTPTAYGTAMDIYANWNIDVDNGLAVGVEDGTMAGDSDTDDPWDFRTSSEYPALRVDFNGDGIPTAFEFGGQGRTTVPSAPSALMATAADAEVTLNWTAPTSDGGAPITNYMVEYDTDMNFSSSPTTVSTAAAATSHTVSALTNGTPYYFRVAAVNSSGTGAYYPGATDAAVSATPVAPATVPDAPVVSSFTPEMGVVGEAVMITGTGFSATATENTVVFLGAEGDADNAAATVSAATATLLTVSVPSTAQTGKISVMVGTAADTSDASFTVTGTTPAAPVVLSFSPTEGVVDTEVTITGVNFSATPSANEVRFGGVMAADPTSASTTSLTVKVPSGARTGSISVAVGGQTGTSSEIFTVTGTTPAPAAPVVSSFSPTEGEVDTEVTITGVNFSDVPSENDLRFGGVMAADPTSASTTSLTVKVPSGARTGSISVAVGGQTGTSSEDFTVTGTTPAPDPPVVLSFSPSEGEVGISVTITGENFSATALENEVKFGGVMAAEPTSASTTTLTVRVPSGARTGSISVAVGGQTGTSSTNFTVTGTTPEPAAFSVPLSSEGDVRLYPNPTSGQLHFKGLLAGGRYVCDLYSLVGQKVLSSVVRAGDTMDTSTLSSAQYILILQAEGRELMRTRLLVVR